MGVIYQCRHNLDIDFNAVCRLPGCGVTGLCAFSSLGMSCGYKH